MVEVSATLMMYFAYGSNLLADRFFIHNKGERIGTGKLMDYSLGFNVPEEFWAGNVLTIVPSKGEHVMGAVWNVTSDIRILDEQEVGYFSFPVNIEMDDGRNISCRTYQLKDLPQNCDHSENLPSFSYLKAIVKGALESKLPDYYIKYLKNITHNGKIAVHMENTLKLHDIQLV
ncbi:GGCT.2 family protein [Megaselia abdita]